MGDSGTQSGAIHALVVWIAELSTGGRGWRKLIDGYNAAKEARPAVLACIMGDSQRRDQVRDLLDKQRQKDRENDRGTDR